MTFIKQCTKCAKESAEKYKGMTTGQRLVAIACEPVKPPCKDCKIMSRIVF